MERRAASLVIEFLMEVIETKFLIVWFDTNYRELVICLRMIDCIFLSLYQILVDRLTVHVGPA